MRSYEGLEMGPLGRPVVTSHRLHKIGLSLTVFAVLRLVTDRQTDGRTCFNGATLK